jgi:putative ABC transport system permease protein
MWRVTLKGILAQRLRLVLTGLAVVIGVGFVSGTYVFGDTLNKAFDNLFSGIYANTDVVVQGSSAVSNNERPPFPESVLATVRRVDGVAEAEGSVEGPAQLVKADGKAVTTGGAPAQGFSWDTSAKLNPLDLVEGRPPTTADDVVLEKHNAGDNGFKVGQDIRIIVPAGPKTYRLVGLAQFPDGQSLGGSTTALFTLPEAQRAFQKEGLLDSINVAADPGVSPATLRDRIAAVVPHNLEVRTAQSVQQQQSKDIKDQLSILTTFLLVFGFISVFVAAFIIFNTFSITVAQRARQLALLRAIGASGAQVTRMVIAEALVIGVIASVLGLLLGFGIALAIRGLFSAVGAGLPTAPLTLTTRTIVVGMLVGVLVTLAAALLPALRAARLSPMAALRSDVTISTGSRRRRIVIGTIVTLIGAAGVALALQGNSAGQVLTLLGAGVLILFIGLAMLAPLIARPLARILGAPAARFAGVAGKLGRENAMRNPQRTAQTATALTIGLALVTFVTVFAASFSTSIGKDIDRQLKGDLVIYDQSSFLGFPLTAERAVAKQPLVQTVTAARGGTARAGGSERAVSGVDPAAIAQAYDPEFTSGGWADLTNGGVAVSKDVASSLHVKVGDRLPVVFPKGGRQVLVVRAIYKSNQVGDMIITLPDFERFFTEQLDLIMFVNGKPGADPGQLQRQVQAALAPYPNLTVQNQAQYKQYVEDQVNGFLQIVYGLLALAIIIAVFGIVNTLALSIFERTREIGLLRAVGMSARQARRMVRWEAVIVALLGGLLGVVLGLVFGVVLASATPDVNAITIPIGRIVIFFVLAGLAGVLAAIWPARRAAKLDVLRAVAHE